VKYTSLEQAIQEPAARSSVDDQCRQVLLDIIAGRLPIEAVRHPLGFFCLPVVREGELGVCIHLWTSRLPGTELTTSTVHCHSWDLVSFVLYGLVSNTLFSVDDDLDGRDRIFEIRSQDDIDEIVPTPRLVRCTQKSPQLTTSGTSYRMSGGQFHANAADPIAGAATLVLGRTRDTVDLSIGDRDLGRHQTRRQRCSPDETAQIARITLEHLEPGW
jgi:hypothetical protein